MSSLTQISIASRRTIRYGIYLLVLILFIRLTYNVGLSIYRRIFPPKPPEPNVAFGKLPTLPFPEKSIPENITYKLELPEGSLPKLTEQAEVYAMPLFQTSITVVDDARNKAQLLGFKPDGKVLVESIPNVYIFEKINVPSRLTMNIITGIFSINYNINENPAVVSGTPILPEQAITHVRQFLQQAKLQTDDIKDGVATYEFLKYEGNKFVDAIALNEANAIKVNLFRKGFGLDPKPVTGTPEELANSDVISVTPDMPEANIWFIVAGERQIVAGEYHYFPIDAKSVGTYPLKTSEIAWQELQEGKGYIANPGLGGEAVIRRVYLGYYDPGQYTEYYQPVFVFEGDNNFFAYVPAVVDTHYGNEQNQEE